MMPKATDVKGGPKSIDEEFKKKKKAKSCIFFDLECTQDNFIECDMNYNPDIFWEMSKLYELQMWCNFNGYQLCSSCCRFSFLFVMREF